MDGGDGGGDFVIILAFAGGDVLLDDALAGGADAFEFLDLPSRRHFLTKVDGDVFQDFSGDLGEGDGFEGEFALMSMRAARVRKRSERSELRDI